MPEKKEAIQMTLGAAADLISKIKELPTREKGPDEVITLSELFHMKDFLTEAKSLIDRGYSARDLARLVTEKCGTDVSARQVKYFITYHSKKRRKRHSSSKQPNTQSVESVYELVESVKTSDNHAKNETESDAELLEKSPDLPAMCSASQKY